MSETVSMKHKLTDESVRMPVVAYGDLTFVRFEGAIEPIPYSN